MPEPSKIVACPNCATLNRVPLAKLGGGGKCGRCGAALFAGKPVELHAGNFEAHASKSELPLVIDFWAAWCGPCRQMAPALAAAAAQLEPVVRIGKLDTEAEPGLAARFGIRSIPTLVVVSRGCEIARKAGVMPAGAITGWVRQVASNV